MALITEPSSPTVATTAGQVAANLRAGCTAFFKYAKAMYVSQYRQFWNTPNVTPEENAAALATDAAALFARSAQLAQLLADSAPSPASLAGVPMSVPDGFGYMANQDGTVTITRQQ